MKKLTTAILAFAITASATMAQPPKREHRSAWLTTYMTIDWPSERGTTAAKQKTQKAELIEYIENHKKRNFNAVYFHVRTGADAVYESSYEPWSEYVSGTRGVSPGYDPLAFVVEECHKRGMECYAWVNPFRFRATQAMSRTTKFDKDAIDKGWFIKQTSYETFNPGMKECREHILKVVREIYTKYRVDGLIFDDYFYPNNIVENESAEDWATYQTDTKGLEIGDWRRENINSFMRELYDQIKADRPDLTFGLSPAGIAHNKANYEGLPAPVANTNDWQFAQIYSDPVAWLHDGAVDFISPQLYWFSKPGNNSYTTAAPYEALTKWWTTVAHHYNRNFYVSLGPYRFLNGEDKPVYNNEAHWADLSNQIAVHRNYNTDCGGQVYFSAKYMDGPKCSGWGDYLQAHSYQYKALTPKITWKERPEITAPDATLNGSILSWTPANTTGNAPIMRYTVYAVPASVSMKKALGADGIGATYLLDVIYGGSYTLPADRLNGYWYAVCAYDGYGFESEPTIINYVEPIPQPVSKDPAIYADIDGHKLQNLWYRSVSEGFDKIDFIENGSHNRGMAISGNYVYMTNRTGSSAAASAYISEWDLASGELLREIPVALPAVGFMCNDIVTDAEGTLYITNLALTGKTLTVHIFDPETGTVDQLAELALTTPSSGRIDHAAVEKTSTGHRIYAAVAGTKYMVRWTLAGGNVTKQEAVEAKSVLPASVGTFGTAPRIFHIEGDRVVVNGSGIMPCEYDFATGTLLSAVADIPALASNYYSSNGFAHFGADECFFAYPVADHFTEGGFQFRIARGNSHGFTESASELWTVPQTGMGQNIPQYATMSTPIAARTTTTENGWYSDIAFLAPGNGLAVYRLTAPTSGVVAPELVECTISGGNAYFEAPVVCASICTMSGMEIARVTKATSIALPSAPGIYILKADTLTRRIVVR